MKTESVYKYGVLFVLIIAIAGLNTIFSSCGGGGGGGGQAPVPLQTTASLTSGIYDSAQSVTLTSNKPATIYYSLNGAMPSVGGIGTLNGPSPITNIPISNDTNLLQFFAIDQSGGQEAVKSETYVINAGAATGPGDPLNYLPLDQGNTWGMKVTFTETGYSPITYADTYAVTGEKVIKGALAVIHTETNPDNSSIATEDHILKSSNGVVLLDYRDPADPLTAQLVPYYLYNFSLLPGSSYVAINRTGLDFGEDLDYDGKNETADIVAVFTMKGMESVTVPDDTYANCARIEIHMTVTVTITSDNERIAVETTQTEWYAPGIGLVKSIVATTGDYYSSTQTEELAGHIVNGTEHGALKNQQTGDATYVTDSYVYLTGTYNLPSSNAYAYAWFEYGPTSSYGSKTMSYACSFITGSVYSSINGLQQLTTYHYRLVTSYDGFVIYGNDKTFKTLITPTVVASGLDYPSAIALDALNVYFIETNAVKKVGKTGGIVTLLTSDAHYASSLAVDAASVYWGEYYGDNAIKKISINGGNVTTLAGSGNIQAIALDSSSVYWCNSGGIYKVGIDGGDVSTIAGEIAATLVVDSTYVYFTHPNGGLKRVGLNGGTVTDLAGGGGYHIAIDAINVYYNDGGIKKYNKSDGSIVALTSEPRGIYNITVDATDVFWVEDDPNSTWGTLKKVSINGGDVTILAYLSSSNFYGLGVDDTYVYWSEQDYIGTIKKVPKNY